MGEMMQVRCNACGKTWRCIAGTGLLYADKGNIISAFSQREREKITAMLASGGIPSYDFQYRLSVCGHCRNVVSVPTLRLSEEEKPYIGLCPLCGKRTKNACAAQDTEAWGRRQACPACKSRALQMEEAGYWD